MNNSYIKGSVREIFYKTDKGYMVGVFKVRETVQLRLCRINERWKSGFISRFPPLQFTL